MILEIIKSLQLMLDDMVMFSEDYILTISKEKVNSDLKHKYRRFKRFYYNYEYYTKPLNKVFPSVKLYHRKIL